MSTSLQIRQDSAHLTAATTGWWHPSHSKNECMPCRYTCLCIYVGVHTHMYPKRQLLEFFQHADALGSKHLLHKVCSCPVPNKPRCFKDWTFNIWTKPNEDCGILEKVLGHWLLLQILVSTSEKWTLCPRRAVCTVPSIPSGSWRCTCPWTGSLSCSRACSPSPGPWPARGRRGILCRQTSTRRQTVSQAQLGQNCSGDTGDRALLLSSG